VNLAAGEMPGQVGDVFGLARRQAAAAQLLHGAGQDALRG
jgi:hypothetical protein